MGTDAQEPGRQAPSGHSPHEDQHRRWSDYQAWRDEALVRTVDDARFDEFVSVEVWLDLFEQTAVYFETVGIDAMPAVHALWRRAAQGEHLSALATAPGPPGSAGELAAMVASEPDLLRADIQRVRRIRTVPHPLSAEVGGCSTGNSPVNRDAAPGRKSTCHLAQGPP